MKGRKNMKKQKNKIKKFKVTMVVEKDFNSLMKKIEKELLKV